LQVRLDWVSSRSFRKLPYNSEVKVFYKLDDPSNAINTISFHCYTSRVVSDLTISDSTISHPAGFRNSNLDRSGFGEIGSENNMPDNTNGVNNAVSCYKEPVQFSASFAMSLAVAI